MPWTYKKAVVIDDAFGPPTAGSVSSQDKDAWVDFILQNEEAQKRLLDAYEHLKPSTIGDLLGKLTASSAFVQDLWDRYQKAQLTGAGLETLFATESLNRQATAEKAVLIREFLIREIGEDNVQSFYDLPSAHSALAEADVAFVDFFLSSNERTEEALARIRSHKDALGRPQLLFFMSSRADMNTQQRVREEIHTRSAFFEVMDKSEITEEFVRSKLSRKSIDFETNKALESIVVTLAQSMKDAADKLIELTETLETHDLMLLNLARLEAEGETIPEYLTWLFSEFVAAQARRNIQQQKLVVLKPTQVGFNGQLHQSRVLFELFSEIVFAPGRNSDEPLRFGEVLQSKKNQSEYLLLLTPACDFARCDNQMEVLCVRGEAVTFDGPRDHASRRLYGKAGSVLCHLRVHSGSEVDGSKYSLITWDTKSVFTRPMNELRGEGYNRVQAMNELFAQEVKEEALRSLGRVGTQINPPPAAALSATARWKAGSQQEPREMTTPEDAFLAALVMYSERPVLGKDNPVAGPLIVLSDAFRAWLKREIEVSFENDAHDTKLMKCVTELDQEHFQAKASFQFKQNNLIIQVRSKGESLEEKLSALLEITLWIDS
jgi:hypothetical protein